MILALGPAPALAGIAAGAEEEGVPCETIERAGDAAALGREAAASAAGGVGIGADGDRVVVCLAAWSREPYVELDASRARLAGQIAGRLTSRRPLPSYEA